MADIFDTIESDKSSVVAEKKDIFDNLSDPLSINPYDGKSPAEIDTITSNVSKISSEHNLPYTTTEEYYKWAENYHSWKDNPSIDNPIDNAKRTEFAEHIDWNNQKPLSESDPINSMDLERLKRIGITDIPTAEEFNKQFYDTMKSKGNIGVLEMITGKHGNWGENAIPVVAEAKSVYYALLANKEYMGTISNEESTQLNQYRAKLKEESIRGKTLPAMILDGIVGTSKYGIEFMLTGGIYTTGRAVGRKAGAALLGKWMRNYWARAGIKTAGALAGTLPRTLAMSYKVAGDTADQYTMGEKEIYKEVGKNFGKLYISNFAELSGEGLNDISKNIARNMIRKIPATTTMGRILRGFPENEIIQNVKQGLNFFKRAGIQNAPQELFEEYFERVLDASVGLGRWEDVIPEGKQMIAEAAVVSALPLAGGIVQGANALFKNSIAREAEKILNSPEFEQIQANKTDLQTTLTQSFSEFATQHPELNEEQLQSVLHSATIDTATPAFEGSETLVNELKTQYLDVAAKDYADKQNINIETPEIQTQIETPVRKRIISEEAYNEAKARMRPGAGGLTSGVDPQRFVDLLTIGAYHVENGIVKFADWSAKMIEELGEDVKPMLRKAWNRIQKNPEKYIYEAIAQTPVQEAFRQAAEKQTGKTITEQQALKLRFKQQIAGSKAGYEQALTDIQEEIRLGKQKSNIRGFKQGYKIAANEARENLRNMMMSIKENREGAYTLVKQFVPKEEQEKFLVSVRDAQTDKDVKDLSEKINKFIDVYEHRKALSEFKSFIKSINKEYKSGKIKLGKLPNAVREKIFSLIDAYDLVNISPEKMVELNNLQERIKAIAGSMREAYSNWNELVDNGEEILRLSDSRIEELNRLNQMPISEITTDEIENLQADIQDLIDVSEKKIAIKRRIRAEQLGKDITDSRAELYDRGRTGEGAISEPSGVHKIAIDEQSQLRTLVGEITGKVNDATMKVIVDNVYDGYKKRNEKYRDFITAFNRAIEDNGLDETIPKTLDEKVEITLGGKTFTTKTNYLLALYMHTMARNGLNLRSLLESDGLNVHTAKRGYVRTGQVTLSELRDATNKLSKEQKLLGEIYFEINNLYLAPAINETSLELENREIAVYNNYWHISREISRELEGSKVDLAVPIEWQGRWKPITGGKGRVNIDSFSSEVMKSLQLAASYNAMTIPFQDARTLVMNKEWRNKIKETGNETILKNVINIYRKSFGMMSEQTMAEQYASGLLGKIGRSFLAARLSGAFIQLAGVPAAWEVIEPKYFINLSIPTPEKMKKIEDENASLWIRWKGKQFNYALGTQASLNSFNELLFNKTKLIDRTTDPYTWGDMVQIYYVYQAAVNKTKAETSLKQGTAEFTNEVNRLVDRAVETQGQFDILHRSSLTSSNNVFLRAMTLFMSARNAQYNVALRAINDFKRGRISAGVFSERLGSITLSTFLEAVIRKGIKWTVKGAALAYLLSLADDDDEKKKLTETAKKSAIKDAERIAIDFPLNAVALSVFGQMGADIGEKVISGLSGRSNWGNIADVRTGNIIADLVVDISALSVESGLLARQLYTGEIYKTGDRAGQEKWKTTILDLADNLAETTSSVTGLPYSGIKGDFVYPVQNILNTRKKIEKDFDYRIKNMTTEQLYIEREKYTFKHRYNAGKTIREKLKKETAGMTEADAAKYEENYFKIHPETERRVYSRGEAKPEYKTFVEKIDKELESR
jgi:hypothetical protein